MKIGNDSPWQTSVPHPALSGKQLYFFADVPHILKNVRAALCNGRKFKLPKQFLEKWSLPSPWVTFQHLEALCDYQENLQLKPAPRLTKSLLQPTHFEKMNVAGALAVFDYATPAALRHLVEDCGYPSEYLTTAKFVEVFRHWFDLVNSRSSTMALSKFNEGKYKEALEYIDSVIELFKTLEVDDGKWKPYQTGVITTSLSILSLQKDLLEEEGFDFFLTSRISQDSLENTFSMIRIKNPTPTPKEFKYNLRAISAAQYMKDKKTSNYDHDEALYLVNCLGTNLESNLERNGVDDMDEFVRNFTQKLDTGIQISIGNKEEQSLYYFCGYVVLSAKKNPKFCDTCFNKFEHSNEEKEEAFPADNLVKLREFKDGALFHCSEKAFYEFFVPAEGLIRSFETNELLQSKNVLHKVMSAFQTIKPDYSPKCRHDIEHFIAKKFFRARLHFIARESKPKKKGKDSSRSSKSTEMRRLVSSVK